MEISLKANSGYELIFKAENVNITEDIEERIYFKDDNGKTDYLRAPERDIKDEAIEQIANVLDDIIYYRKKDFDSSSLIANLFDKLSQESADALLIKLNKQYSTI